MDLVKSDMQRELSDLVARLMREKNDFGDLQERLAKDQHVVSNLWASLAELGLLGVPFNEELGGTGGGFADLAAVLEALGKGLCVEPYIANVVVCGSLLSEDSPLLASMISGETLLAFAHAERHGVDNPEQLTTHASSASDTGHAITGTKCHVFGGNVADHFIVSARSAVEHQGAEVSLFLVDRNAPGVSVKNYITNDNMGCAVVTLEGAPAQPVAPAGEALSRIALANDKATAAICAEAVGAMEALLEATLEHVTTRKQFGTTIGSFQVVQHMTADLLVNLEHARSLSMAASCYADFPDELERTRVISAAKVGVNDAARFVAKTAVQLHGGIGMTEECAVGHYFRRLSSIRLSYGDSSFHLERMGTVEDQRITC